MEKHSAKFRMFRRKREETPYEAIARLDRRMAKVKEDLQYWITLPTRWAILVTHKLEHNVQHLEAQRKYLVDEIKDRDAKLRQMLRGDK